MRQDKREVKEKKPAAKAKKEKRPRGPNHTWLASGFLIRFIEAHPSLTTMEVAERVCIAMDREYVSTTKGDGRVVASRLSNLVHQHKIQRDDAGQYFATDFGLEWAAANEPEAVG